ncbi:flavin monoamine oxidase family protein [Nocardia pseudobrasiliensis]|uniref:Monoamine oxidase n=1 Tax=Nocardia pseudobrasiliensis TaxID=45979 RepID=A0A370IBZ5_9NOCA|nr:FAD-dependent oxidoreductase [Nocardia pseudobrasiliensis]RDI68252.1 monoamine oxidase [Nocardia pseudobrasiliensis]
MPEKTIGRRGFFSVAGALAVGAAVGGGLRSPTAYALPASDSGRTRNVAEELAREMLQIGEDNSDLTLDYLKILIDQGLPKTADPKKVVVVGAGPAGLTTGWLLKNAGHEVTVLEANSNRTGGRVKTFRDRFEDKRLYAEAGAMRLPDSHPLVLALCDKLGVKRRPFYISDVVPDTPSPLAPPPVTYTSFTGETWTNHNGGPAYRPPAAAGRTLIRVNGERVTRAEYAADPSRINRTFGGAPFGTTTRAALNAAIEKYVRGVDQPIDRQIGDWSVMFEKFEHFSTFDFLLAQGWEQPQIQAVGTLENLSSRLHYGVIPMLVDHALIRPDATFWEIEGGTATLTDALTRELGTTIQMGCRMTQLSQTDTGVRITTVSEQDRDDVPSRVPASTRTIDADYAVVAIPLSAVRFCTFEPPLSYSKRRAVIGMHQDAATKVLLEFKTRFWESGAQGFRGGGCVTDNPNRFAYFPSHVDALDGGDRPAGGVVLASYTWSDDALRWDSLTPDERVDQALHGLADIFGSDTVLREFTGVGLSQSWMQAHYALGEATIAMPNQLTELHQATRTVEGRVHFAGDHTTLKPAWIAGALESAVRAALELHSRR